MFDRGDGGAVPPTVLGTALARACAAAGVPPRTIHQLRHTCGTLMAAAKVHPKVAAERLGHTTVEMVMRYVHATSAMHADAAGLLADALGDPERHGSDTDDGGGA